MTFSIPEPQSQPNPARAVTGRKALWMLLGFFGVILAVNATFVYLAVSSFSGLETDNAYVKGLNYNTTLSRAAEQKALGWQVEFEQSAKDAERSLITLRYLDRNRRPLETLQVEIELRRPTSQDFDQTLALQAVEPGVYRAEVAFPMKGAWLLRGRAMEAGVLRHSMEMRLWVE